MLMKVDTVPVVVLRSVVVAASPSGPSGDDINTTKKETNEKIYTN